MPRIIEKKLTNLYQSADVDALLDNFRALTGSDLAQVIFGEIEIDDSAGVLIVGSIAEGLATPSSDLDVLVLVDANELKPLPGLVSSASNLSAESVFYHQGVELNVEIVRWVNVGSCLDTLLSVAPALYNPADVLSVPLLSDFECRFIHRLRTGWPMAGEATVSRWRDELLVDLLPICLAARYLIEAISFVEDMYSCLEVRSGSAGYMARMAVERLMLGTLALQGQTSPSHKYLLTWLDAAESENSDVVRRGRALLCAELPTGATPEEATFCHRASELAQDVEAQMSSVSEIATAVRYVRSKRCFHDTPREMSNQ